MFAPIVRLGAVIGGLLVAGTGMAWGASILSNAAPAMLGQPLSFVALVRLDGNASLSPDCVTADVNVADRPLPAAGVRTEVEMPNPGLARVRVKTLQQIDEPVVTITLRVGCGSNLSRKFVVFADPPAFAQTAAALPLVAAAPLSVASSITIDRVSGAVIAPPAQTAPAAAAGGQRSAAVESAAAVSAGRPSAPFERRALASRTPAPERSGARRAPAAPNPARPAVALQVAEVALAAQPRLRLDSSAAGNTRLAAGATSTKAADPVDAAIEAVAQAASAVRASAAAATAAADRIATLERTVTQLRTESQAQQLLVAQLRDGLAEGPSRWVWPLLLTSLALAALVAWLAWRLGLSQATRQQAWTRAGGASSGLAATAGHATGSSASDSALRSQPAADSQGRAPTGPAPFLNTELPGQSSGFMSGATQPSAHAGAAFASGGANGGASAAGVLSSSGSPSGWSSLDGWGASSAAASAGNLAMARTEPLPQPLNTGVPQVRDVSIEELIDLEQQAEFFLVLGQDEAAVDLLVDHLRSTGGGSPLPYLKLLEIYRRTGDHDAYQRIRDRFNHRFNAYAPEWGSDLSHGRALEDYQGILPRLEQVWPRPLDAMAELEALLFRKSRGELFELPAYREVLFLYALARDLLDRESADTGSVDLLLPLPDGTAFGSTEPAPFMHLESPRRLPATQEEPIDFDNRPTGPLDFDLTIPAQQASIFDPVEPPTRQRERG